LALDTARECAAAARKGATVVSTSSARGAFYRISLLVTIVLIVVACSEDTSQTTTTQNPGSTAVENDQTSDEMVELVMWNIPLSDSYTAFWEDYITEFNDSHADIRVTQEIFDTETLKTKIRSALLAGSEPDIWFFFPGEFTTLNFREGRIQALDDVIPVDEYTPEAVDRCRDGDSTICLPLFLAPSAVYYNKALFREAGVDPSDWADPEQPTLEEFYATSDALLAEGITPLAVGNAENWPFMHLYWAAQNRFGGTEALEDAVLRQDGASYEDPSFVQAGEFVQDLVERDLLTSGFNAIGGGEKYALFYNGEAAMIYQGPWMIAIAEGDGPADLDYGMFRFPSFDNGNSTSQRDMMAGLDALFVSSSTSNIEAVGTFLSGFSDEETAYEFMVETNNISPIRGVSQAVVDSGEANEKLIALATMLAGSEHTYQWWDWLLPPEVAEAMLDVSQPLALGEITPEEAAARMERAVQE
jgi:raffinose/stachyose/melibiose transport system substrate-binding protein